MEIPEKYPKQYWHCRVDVETGGKETTTAVFNDLTINELWTQVIEPWRELRIFTIDGTIIRDHNNVKKIKITHTPNTIKYYTDEYNALMHSRNISDLATDRRLLPLSNGEDYTHELLFLVSKNVSSSTGKTPSNSKIFIVHGHDQQVKESTARFIEKLGLEAIILHEQANEGQTIIEKLEKHTDVGYSIVLLTPDDIGASVNDKNNLKPRARQNVLLEFGYMAAKLGRKHVCALKKDDIEFPADFLGILYIDIDLAGAWRLLLAKELKTAGLNVDLNKAI